MALGYAGEAAQAPPETSISRMEQMLDATIQRLGNLEIGLSRVADRLYGAFPQDVAAPKMVGGPISEPLVRRVEAVTTALDRVERAAVRLDHGN